MTALHYAARIGHASLVDLLIKHGCEVAAKTDQVQHQGPCIEFNTPT